MAMAELRPPSGSEVNEALGYLAKNAKTFEQVRIAVAGAEAYKTLPDDMKGWADDILKDRNPDGTFGSGQTQARETGGKAVAAPEAQARPAPKTRTRSSRPSKRPSAPTAAGARTRARRTSKPRTGSCGSSS